ncbi:shikimate dehydrogenase family protein [Pseudobacter ginsenosidimutans]|uniref:Shikimate dehydrogenase n=1 Tax=Pseudobacter ginsenosidimutans TaxID=661488 RepID=A0A4Q7MM12_9BACT|nr:shikimate dehydrogenase [Pseudobacter ginsenosidimutans]QEC45671.1 shikimate dehydrogenase [Pseudobacter ginsenosidimutans]RZS69394.1 shikimate dehydrogenase [Pseudobacter ginsenosidimutans]
MRRYGLIGYPLGHSFSQPFFTEKFRKEGIQDCVYQNFPIPEIAVLKEILASYTDLAGLNVTIPYKEQVIPFLHHMEPVVQAIGACNCIRIENGELTGFNTDVLGFERSLSEFLQPSHRKALVLGTGGAAKAICYVLEQKGIDYLIISRNPSAANQRSYEQVTPAIIDEYTLIVNTTPVGMYPKEDAWPALPYEAISSNHYLYDLVYNPARTQFLQRGEAQGAAIKNGMDMLVIQAEESWRIWNEK